MENSTRLADLPPMSDNIQYSLPPGGGFAPPSQFPQPQMNMRKSDEGNGLGMGQGMGQGQGLGQGNYMPLNVHPNPFGNASGNEVPQWDAIPPPQSNPPRNHPDQTTSLEMIPDFVPPQPQRLPSRDIPTSQNHYTHDEEIQANYVPPPPPKVKDYIKEYDETESKRVRDHEIAKYRQDWMEDIARSYQIPLLLAILYFIFQMKVVSRVMFAYLGRLGWFYQEDGSLNVYGMGLKSGLFAGLYWILMYVQQSVL
jgi:hypothetical protein